MTPIRVQAFTIGSVSVYFAVTASIVDPPERDPADQAAGFVPVTISAVAAGDLAPAVAVPLNLAFDNPNEFPLALTDIRVSVVGIEAPRARPERPCTSADYVVRQLAGPAALTVDTRGETDLLRLELTPGEWPAITLVDRPVNQDGCKEASLTLSFQAVGTRVQP